MKAVHEFRDPIHGFIHVDRDERRVIDSLPFQRLRHIHQLALTSLVYPGATHKRFEHSLGVMELASRIFDVVTNPNNLRSDVAERLRLDSEKARSHWRTVLRLASLCHDIGHLPFSHAAEKTLLGPGWDHERLTKELMIGGIMKPIWNELDVPVDPELVAKIALGPRHWPADDPFSELEQTLSEIITGDALGADRMDYLLRDSHHAGVAYGKFDHLRLIETMRIIGSDGDEELLPEGSWLGIEEGGLHAAEALLIARYMMYTQVYFHPVRRAYDIHLTDFLAAWLPEKRFRPNVGELLYLTDNEVLSAIAEAARDPARPGADAATRIVSRQHFKELYRWRAPDTKQFWNPVGAIAEAAQEHFGADAIRRDRHSRRGRRANTVDFRVLRDDGRANAFSELSALQVPPTEFDFLFVKPELTDAAADWLRKERDRIFEQAATNGGGDQTEPPGDV